MQDPPLALFREVELATAGELFDELLPHRGERLWANDGVEKEWIFRGQADAAGD